MGLEWLCNYESTVWHDFTCSLWQASMGNDMKQGKSEGFDSCDQPSNLTMVSSKIHIKNSSTFQALFKDISLNFKDSEKHWLIKWA